MNKTVDLAGWASPTANDKVRSEEFSVGREPTPREALTGWSTPQTHDVRKRGNRDNPAGGGGCLALDADLSGWPTPNSMEGGSTSRSGDRKDELLIGGLVQGMAGVITTSSTAETASRGVLAPEFPRWLMGFPSSWDHCSPGYKEWEQMQALLKQWQNSLDATESDACEPTETPSSPK